MKGRKRVVPHARRGEQFDIRGQMALLPYRRGSEGSLVGSGEVSELHQLCLELETCFIHPLPKRQDRVEGYHLSKGPRRRRRRRPYKD